VDPHPEDAGVDFLEVVEIVREASLAPSEVMALKEILAARTFTTDEEALFLLVAAIIKTTSAIAINMPTGQRDRKVLPQTTKKARQQQVLAALVRKTDGRSRISRLSVSKFLKFLGPGADSQTLSRRSKRSRQKMLLLKRSLSKSKNSLLLVLRMETCRHMGMMSSPVRRLQSLPFL
jgi:primosomal protein N'